jgi:class 3 adenylate cyclase
MSICDEGLLDEKLGALEKARAWSPRTMAKLEALLHAPEEAALLRINPLAFARERSVPATEALDLFLHAAHLGLFTLDWHLLCSICGTAVESFASLRTVHQHLYCPLCLITKEVNLDDFIQVSFTVAPAVRRLSFHDPFALSAEDYLYRLRMTPEMHLSSVDGPRMRELMHSIMKVLVWVPAGGRHEFAFDGPAGSLSVAEFHGHSGLMIQIGEDAPEGPLDVTIGDGPMTATSTAVRPGRITGQVINQRTVPLVFAIDHHDPMPADMAVPTTVMEPIVTGAMLLTNQTFRRLFRSETVLGADGIGLREVTVLFTDLKGSTALYERIGDLKAFALVQQHFDRLGMVVGANGGAIVKTIGDAVMAAFQRPVDAVRAAFEMLEQIERFNGEQGADDLVLKIGIHRGPSIAVTLNQSLDFFGHTVNVAARVQALADADEVYVTDDVYRSDGVAALLGEVDSRDAQLRGIQKQVRVHRALRRPRQHAS